MIRPAAGPDRKTLKSTDNATLLEYVAAKPGFVVLPEGERIWVFRPDSPELEQLQQQGELARHVIRPGAGPLGATLKGPDTKTINDYLTSAPGFVTRFDNGRLWVFREGSDELKQFEADGELAKHVIRVAAGPAGLTVKAPDAETMQDYLEAVGQ